MSILFLDVETYSEVPISHGTHAYAVGCEVMIAAYAWDNDPVYVEDYTQDNCRWREKLKEMSFWADAVVIHNSHFDRTVLGAHGIDLPTDKVHDTMAMAMAHSLPGALDKLCAILNVPVDLAKAKDGKKLINLFCKPRPKRNKLRRATRETHPKEWQQFLDYARLDIEAVREVYKRLPRKNNERELWLLDQKINDRGITIDIEFVEKAIGQINKSKDQLAVETQRLTDDHVRAATQRDEVLRFILEAHGIRMDDLRASTVEAMLEDDSYPPELHELLRVRLLSATTSTAKYPKLLTATNGDHRLRGLLQYCGAQRTGRWAGRLFQPQNLPRPSLPQHVIDRGIADMKADAYDELLHGPVMEFCSAALRGVMIAAPGKKLVVADLANIEGRVIAWLAGEDWKLDAFIAYDKGIGEDLYKVTAGRILGKKPADVTKLERQELGKVSELALGFEGGVGAFIAFASSFGTDLDALGKTARENLDVGFVWNANRNWDWRKEKKMPTYGLPQKTWVGIEAIKLSWRDTHPMIAALWQNLGNAVRSAINIPGKLFEVGVIRIHRYKSWLYITLPSGRSLCYPAPQVDDAGQISYMGINQYSRKWQRLKTYGGKIAENVTQAVARDVMAAGMLNADKAGFDILLTVHDEIITEVDDLLLPKTVDELVYEMTHNITWTYGLPLAASGFEAQRYRKD